MTTKSPTESVRQYALRTYVEPARRRGQSTLSIVAGDVHKAVGLSNQVPIVCNALKSRKFLEENRLTLEGWDGPPSGLSTTVVFRYRVQPEPGEGTTVRQTSPLLDLWGSGREVFASLGGGEAFLRKERRQFHRGGKDS
jgi:hypothetical protein